MEVDPQISQLGGTPKPLGRTPPRAGIPSAQPLSKTQPSSAHVTSIISSSLTLKRSISLLNTADTEKILLSGAKTCFLDIPTFSLGPRNKPKLFLVGPPFSYVKTMLSCPTSSILGPGRPIAIPLHVRAGKESIGTRVGMKHKPNIY